jgi:hypothetical protein
VKVEPPSNSADVGETFTISIVVVDVQNLYGLEINLYWNASILHVEDVDIRLGVESHPDGVLHEDLFKIPQEGQGHYSVAATSVPLAHAFDGNGTIVRMSFSVTSAGDSKLDLESQLYDYAPPDREPRISFPIEHTTVGGSLNAAQSTSPANAEIPDIIVLALSIILVLLLAAFFKITLRKRHCTDNFTLKEPQRNLLVQEKVSRYVGQLK